jgi:hypothetical protein
MLADKLKDFFKQNEVKIALLTGFVLVAAVSFEFGLMQGKKGQISPLLIEKAAQAEDLSQTSSQGSPPEASKTVQEAKISPASADIPAPDCAFVGSKNSNKYHLSTCRFAKLIKPANLVCFKSAADAEAQGRQPDKGCIK